MRILMSLAMLVVAVSVGAADSTAASNPSLVQSEDARSRHRTKVVHARTASEIIAAMLAANSSGQPTVIRLAAGVYRSTESFESEYGRSWFPPVSGAISIEGRRADDTVFDSAGLLGRAFTIVPGGRLVLDGVTITGGAAECGSPDCSRSGGGAVLNVEGALWIERSVLSGNAAFEFSGRPEAIGGAVLSVGGYLHIEDTTVEGNESLSLGGGLAVLGGSATVRHSIVRGNRLREGIGNSGYLQGGGLLASNASVWILDSTFSANVANDPVDEWLGFGGGIHTSGGTLWLKNSSVIENIAGPVGSGGGIYNGGRMIVENSTIAANSASTLGGGVFNSGTLSLTGVTVARNEVLGGYYPGSVAAMPSYPPGCEADVAPEFCFSRGGGIWNEPSAMVYIANTVVALNTKQGVASDCSGTLVSRGGNALADDTDCVLQRPASHPRRPGDLKNVDVGLGALVENGKPGNAHVPPLAGSALIDAGGEVRDRCSRRDQLGRPRGDGDADGSIRCDIGAIEFAVPRRK